MLCERCHQVEATVHFAIVSWPSGELSSHFCGSCYPQAEAERSYKSSYQSDPPPPPLVNPEQLTASQFIELSARAAANGVDKPAYNQLFFELGRLPATQERLSIELLEMALEYLRKGEDPRQPLLAATCFGLSAGPRRQEYIKLLESVILRLVDLLVKPSQPASIQQFGFGLTMAALALRQADQNRFNGILNSMKDQCDGTGQDQMTKVIEALEGRIAWTDQSIRRKGRKPTRGPDSFSTNE